MSPFLDHGKADSRSGHPEAPTAEQLRSAIAEEKGYAIQLNRQDAGIFINVSIDGYPTGIKFMPPHGWTYWNNLHIKDADVGIHFTGKVTFAEGGP